MNIFTDEPNERHSLAAEAEQAIEDEATAAAAAVRAKRRTELLLAMLAVKTKAEVPAEVKHVTVAAYATSRSISKATVLRYVADGMPTVPVGTTVRIDPVAADNWRQARGRKPTTPEPKRRTENDRVDVDVSTALAGAALRVVGGSR